jgi:hypothetical protein
LTANKCGTCPDPHAECLGNRESTGLEPVARRSKTNEITALPDLLSALDVSGCIVTVDALGSQIEVAQTIIDRGGDYLFALKEITL